MPILRSSEGHGVLLNPWKGKTNDPQDTYSSHRSRRYRYFSHDRNPQHLAGRRLLWRRLLPADLQLRLSLLLEKDQGMGPLRLLLEESAHLPLIDQSYPQFHQASAMPGLCGVWENQLENDPSMAASGLLIPAISPNVSYPQCVDFLPDLRRYRKNVLKLEYFVFCRVVVHPDKSVFPETIKTKFRQ